MAQPGPRRCASPLGGTIWQRSMVAYGRLHECGAALVLLDGEHDSHTSRDGPIPVGRPRPRRVAHSIWGQLVTSFATARYQRSQGWSARSTSGSRESAESVCRATHCPWTPGCLSHGRLSDYPSSSRAYRANPSAERQVSVMFSQGSISNETQSIAGTFALHAVDG